MKRRIILIDGENTIHKIASVLVEADLITSRSDVTKFDLKGLIEHALGERASSIFYYAAKVHLVTSDKVLARKTKAMAAWNGHWAPWISNQGVKYVKSGNLQVRDTKKCLHCGRRSLVMQEKGVDVRIAVDLLLQADNNTEVVIVSSDSDLAPAIRAARQKGASVVYLGFDYAMNIALVACSSKTRSFTKPAIIKAYKKVNK